MGEINKDVNENEISTSPETTSEVPTKEVTEADHEQLEPEESDNDDNFNDEAVEKTEESGDDEIDDPKADEEIEEGKKAISVLGGKIKEKKTFPLDTAGERTIILIEKFSSTPGKYPRPSAKMVKNPIR